MLFCAHPAETPRHARAFARGIKEAPVDLAPQIFAPRLVGEINPGKNLGRIRGNTEGDGNGHHQQGSEPTRALPSAPREAAEQLFEERGCFPPEYGMLQDDCGMTFGLPREPSRR